MIAHITSPPVLSITKERLAGYRAALEKYHIPFDENLVKYCEFDTNTIKRIIIELIKKEKPDALFSASDRLALSCYAAVVDLKIKIPEEIAFVGFTNINVAHLLNPPLTTVTQPAEALGRQAAKILLDILDGTDKSGLFHKKELPIQLNIRASSNPVI